MIFRNTEWRYKWLLKNPLNTGADTHYKPAEQTEPPRGDNLLRLSVCDENGDELTDISAEVSPISIENPPESQIFEFLPY